MNLNSEMYLAPETPKESSRLSSPRSSLGDGISTDCEADVESNLSAISSDNSPSRRQSSAYYGFVCRRSCFSGLDDNEKKGKSYLWKISVWGMMKSRKLIFMFCFVLAFLLIIALLFVIPTSETEIGSANLFNGTINKRSRRSWPLRFVNWEAYSSLLLVEINKEGKKAIIFALKQRDNGNKHNDLEETSDDNGSVIGNRSVILVTDQQSASVLKMKYLSFAPDWLLCSSLVTSNANISCHASDSSGRVVKLDLNKQVVIWQIKPCQTMFSFIVIPDVDNDNIIDLMAVCSWTSAKGEQLSGMILISGKNGDVIGSKVRYEVNRKPSSFLMKHTYVGNETYILFGTKQNNQRHVIWAVRLTRVMQIATGRKEGAHLVSENPLKIFSDVREDVEPINVDVNGDGTEDLGFALASSSIAFVDGSSLGLLNVINTGPGNIIRMDLIPPQSQRSFILVFKADRGSCQHPKLVVVGTQKMSRVVGTQKMSRTYTIKLPSMPSVAREVHTKNSAKIAIWFPDTSTEAKCKHTFKRTSVLRQTNSQNKNSDQQMIKLAGSLAGSHSDRGLDGVESPLVDTHTAQLLLNSKKTKSELKTYAEIIKALGPNQKLFHFVCNYILLRFLITYGISTKPMLLDYEVTRQKLAKITKKSLDQFIDSQLRGLVDLEKENDQTEWIENFDSIGGRVVDDNDVDLYWMDASNSRQNRVLDNIFIEKFDKQSSGNKRSRMIRSLKVEDKLNYTEIYNHVRKKIAMAAVADLTDKRQEKLEEQNSPLDNVTDDCLHPVPNLKSLILSTEGFHWKNLTKSENKDVKESKTDNGNCPKFTMKIKDMIIFDNFLFYLANYIPEDEEGSFVSQLNRVKL